MPKTKVRPLSLDDNERVCPICLKRFPKQGKRILCSAECAEVRRLEQVTTYAEKKKAERRASSHLDKVCRLCSTPFRAYNGNQKYCGTVCSHAAFLTAVERFKHRRTAERQTAREEAREANHNQPKDRTP